MVLMPSSCIVTKSIFANQQEVPLCMMQSSILILLQVVLEVDLDPSMCPYALVPTTYEPNDFGEALQGAPRE